MGFEQWTIKRLLRVLLLCTLLVVLRTFGWILEKYCCDDVLHIKHYYEYFDVYQCLRWLYVWLSKWPFQSTILMASKMVKMVRASVHSLLSILRVPYMLRAVN